MYFLSLQDVASCYIDAINYQKKIPFEKQRQFNRRSLEIFNRVVRINLRSDLSKARGKYEH